MRKKQLIIFSILLVMSIFLAACSVSQAPIVTVESKSSDTATMKSQLCISNVKVSDMEQWKTQSIHVDVAYSAKSVEDLEERSVYIVRGVLEDDAVQYVNLIGNTRTSLKINQVYKGNLQPGATITLSEGYWLADDPEGNKWVMHFGDYLPTNIGREYVFFLSKPKSSKSDHSDLRYLPVLSEEGRYPVIPASEISTIKDMPNEKMNLDKGNVDHYRDLYKQVAEKYMQEESK